MMLMMQATGASIISVPFLAPSGTPPTSKKWCSGPDGPRRLVSKTVLLMMHILRGLGDPQNASKIPPCRWDLLPKPM